MALPVGLVPAFVFVLTVGFAVPVTVGSHLFYRLDDAGFAAALRVAGIEAGCLYLVGVLVVWAVAGGFELWEVAAVLLGVGAVAGVVLMILPLLVGRHVVERFRDVDGETALRFATYGWPVVMLVVFGVFIAPGGPAHGDLLWLDGPRTCVVGFCGISIPLAGALLLEAAVAILGPGIVGTLLHAAMVARERRPV